MSNCYSLGSPRMSFFQLEAGDEARTHDIYLGKVTLYH
jgi:hypothetical protein